MGPSSKARSGYRYGFGNKLSRGGTWRRRSRRNTPSEDNVVGKRKKRTEGGAVETPTRKRGKRRDQEGPGQRVPPSHTGV